MSFGLVMAGLALLVVSAASVVWLICQYEARMKALEAQLRVPCPTCQAATQGEAWRPFNAFQAEKG